MLFDTPGRKRVLTSVSNLSRTRGVARGVHPLEARRNPPAAHQHAPKMAPAVPGPDLGPDPGPSQGLGPTGALAGTTPVLVPAPAGVVPGAGLGAQTTAGVGAIVAPRCQIDADTSATGPTQTLTPAWVCLV